MGLWIVILTSAPGGIAWLAAAQHHVASVDTPLGALTVFVGIAATLAIPSLAKLDPMMVFACFPPTLVVLGRLGRRRGRGNSFAKLFAVPLPRWPVNTLSRR